MREFRQLNARSASPRVWTVEVKGNKVITTWGQLGGAMQRAEEVLNAINPGKSNEKSPQEAANQRADRLVELKTREGYREVIKGKIQEAESKITDFEKLPTNLCFYKPDNSMGAGMIKKAEWGQVWYARKRNGLAFIISKGSKGPILFSRRMMRQHDDEVGTNLTWNDRFPHIVEIANQLMPPNSILLGELVVDRNGKDDFAAVQSLTKSLTQQSLEDQTVNNIPSFYIWDIAFWGGKDLVSTTPVKTRYSLIHELDGGDVLLPVEVHDGNKFKTIKHAVEHAKKVDWEGFVVVDPEGVYGEKAYNFKGKPDRPAAFCAKLKPAFEDDFIAIWNPEEGYGERSTKMSNHKGIKSVALYQFNKKGEKVFIANVSSGLSKAQIHEWSDPKKFPMVWKVEYTERFYKSEGNDTNALIFPRFIERRTDKDVKECINNNL